MRGFLTETVETVLLALVVFLLLQASVQNFRVEGASMEPNLGSGDYLLVNKLTYLGIPVGEAKKVLPVLPVDPHEVVYPFESPHQGNIIVFRFPGDPTRFFVKRVIGVPGDTVELREGKVYVNGTLVDEPYLKNRDHSSLAPVHVPPDQYFVLGDNRPFSNDSRDWSFIFVPRSYIIGAAWITYGPISFLDRLYPHQRIG